MPTSPITWNPPHPPSSIMACQAQVANVAHTLLSTWLKKKACKHTHTHTHAHTRTYVCRVIGQTGEHGVCVCVRVCVCAVCGSGLIKSANRMESGSSIPLCSLCYRRPRFSSAVKNTQWLLRDHKRGVNALIIPIFESFSLPACLPAARFLADWFMMLTDDDGS